MRLIDADAYKEVFERNARYYEDLGNYEMAKFNRELTESIDKRPTAYEIDKVISYIDRVGNSGMGKKKSLEYIKKFVKGGGSDE